MPIHDPTGPTERARIQEMFYPERTWRRLSDEQRQICGILAVMAFIFVPFCYALWQLGQIWGLEFQIKSAIWLAEFRS